jgi:class 3 adenylate cyclase
LSAGSGTGRELAWEISRDADTPAELAGDCAITVRNDSPRPACFVLEGLWWERDVLRPGRLFCLPEFQRLFSRDALATGVQLDLGNQTIFFSDIVGSTKFYQEVGDAAAFAAVVEHFEELTAVIRRHGGTVIKTIGDAVMAAFHTPEQCLGACEEAQRAFSGPESRQKVRLRISAHHGPVIAVNWNTGKDYFGNVVNFAAKLQACAGAGEVAISEEIAAAAGSFLERYPARTEALSVAGRAPARIRVFDLAPPSVRERRAG